MNLYKEFETLRDIISEDDQAVCGLSQNRRDEAMRRSAMSTLTAETVAEDENRSDSEMTFFFVNEAEARMCFTKAINLGLAPGEVVFDPTVSEAHGVGKYSVRFAPHVKVTKPEVMFSLWRTALGKSDATPRMFEDWVAETGGSLIVAEDAFAQAQEPSGSGHPYGIDPRSGDPAHALTGKPSRDPGPDPVQSLGTTMEPGRVHAYHTETRIPSDDALRVANAAEKPISGDPVLDGTNGTPIDGGVGSTHYKLAPGADRASPRMEGNEKTLLSEELKSVAGMVGGVDELRSLIE